MWASERQSRSCILSLFLEIANDPAFAALPIQHNKNRSNETLDIWHSLSARVQRWTQQSAGRQVWAST